LLNYKMSVYVFSSPNCKPCLDIKSSIEELKEDFPSYEWNFINILENSELFKKYELEKVPSIVIDNSSIKKYTGTNIIEYYKLFISQ